MKKLYILILAVLPLPGKVRGGLYRLLYPDRIGRDFEIGWLSFIFCKEISIGTGVHIKRNVKIRNLDVLKIGDGCEIGSGCEIHGVPDNIQFQKRVFEVGNNTGIGSSHYFDVAAPIQIGSHVIIAGFQSQFFTHSFDLNSDRMDGGIRIGNHVYIGTRCLVTPGVAICSQVVITGMTTVNKSISETGVYSSSTLFRRGSVREYKQMLAHCEAKVLSTGQTAFSLPTE